MKACSQMDVDEEDSARAVVAKPKREAYVCCANNNHKLD